MTTRSAYRIVDLLAVTPLLVLAHCSAATATSSVAAATQPTTTSSDAAFDPATFVPDKVLASPDEQERMRQWSLSRVDRRYVRDTFQDASHNTFDCIEFDKQPSCAQGGCPATPPTPPSPPPPPGQTSSAPLAAGGSLGPGCAQGTVPILRPNLAVMTRYRTLEDYLKATEFLTRLKGPPPHGQ